MAEELWKRSAIELADMIGRREVTSREVVTAHLARIDAVNPYLNAVTVVLERDALATADSADSAVLSGDHLGPLHGVPMTIKENIDCMGSATTDGVVVLAEAMPSMDAPIVQRMRSAGAIPIGRTNLPEFGLRISTDNALRGRTLNPWHPDLAGSLMSTNGPMARRVADVRLGLEIMSGQHPRDPMSVSVTFHGPPVNRRVGLVTDIGGTPMDPTLEAAVLSAGNALAATGYEVSPVRPPELALVNELWMAMLGASVAEQLAIIGPLVAEGSAAILRTLVSRSQAIAMSADMLITERGRLGRKWAALFREFPILVGPVQRSH